MVKKTRLGNTLKNIKDSKLRSAVLFSGGKDSGLALEYALRYTNVKCLIIMQSKNSESYMFHTPNIEWAKTQAECTGILYIVQITEGEKEKELKDLELAIKKVKTKLKLLVHLFIKQRVE